MENLSAILDALLYVNAEYKNEIRAFESQFDVNVSVSVEKHNSLQYSYYYEIDFGNNAVLNVEIENGINNGTVLIHCDWESSTKPESRTVDILKDIVIDESKYSDKNLLLKAKAILRARKSELFDFHRKNSYDNYVTGGNSKLKLDELLSKLELIYVYEEVQADINFV